MNTKPEERRKLSKKAIGLFLKDIAEHIDNFITEEQACKSIPYNLGLVTGEHYRIMNSKYHKDKKVKIMYSFQVDVYDCPDDESAENLG